MTDKPEQFTLKWKAVAIVMIMVCASVLGTAYAVGSGTGGNSIPTVIESGSGVETASYIIYKDGAYTCGKNGTSGRIDARSTNTSDVIQSTIDLIPNGGMIYITPGEYVLDSGVLIEENVVVQMSAGTVVRPSSSFDVFRLSAYSQLIGGTINVSAVVFTDIAVKLWGSDTPECAQVKGVNIKGGVTEYAEGTGTAIGIYGADGNGYVAFASIESVVIRGFERGIWFYRDLNGGAGYNNYLNGNTFKDVTIISCKNPIKMERSAYVQSNLDGNRFLNIIIQPSANTEDGIICLGNWNYFDVALWDWAGPRGDGFHAIVVGTNSSDCVDNTFQTTHIWMPQDLLDNGIRTSVASSTNGGRYYLGNNGGIWFGDGTSITSNSAGQTASGSVVLEAGQYYVAVVHGFDVDPSTIVVTGTSNETASLYVTIPPGGVNYSFVIWAPAILTANATIYWYAGV